MRLPCLLVTRLTKTYRNIRYKQGHTLKGLQRSFFILVSPFWLEHMAKPLKELASSYQNMFWFLHWDLCLKRNLVESSIRSCLASAHILSCFVYCTLSLWVKWDGIWGCQDLTKSLLTWLEGGLTRLERTELTLCLQCTHICVFIFGWIIY